jgi:hyperosmotically inducible protein
MDKHIMYSQYRKSVLTSSIALALVAASGAALAGSPCEKDQAHNANSASHTTGPDQAASPGHDIASVRQESQILTAYALNSNLRANDLQVSVMGGKATLSGTVEEDVSKELANAIALGTTGIDSVDNQIKVESGYAPAARTSQDRSFGEVVDDASITATVKSKLLWSKDTEGMEMNVDTNNGRVTLNGAAQSDASKALAETTAANTRGVTSVDNRLVVNSSRVPTAMAPGGPVRNSSSEVSDDWITTKVNSTFMYSADVDSNDIEVSTDRGIVTLTGTVDNDAERTQAIALANNIRGVKSVNAGELTL